MSLLNTLVDKIFIINLKNRQDKYNKITRQLHKLNIINYERFDAINPDDSMIRDNQTLVNSSYYGRGVLGCKLSHINVVKIAKQRNYKSILILEDDALFCDNFEDMLMRINTNIIDWKMFYLGANHGCKGIYITSNLRQCYKAYTTSSYIIKSEIYDEIINKALSKHVEIDNFYVDYIQPNYMCVAAYPNLISQYISVSDISHHFYKNEFKNC